jgi:hypothetical protein
MDEIRRHFDDYKHRINRETEKAKELHAQAEAIDAKAQEKSLRIELGLPAADVCPYCWIERGERVPMTAATADVPSRYDRWRCRKCGFAFDQESG